MIKQTYRELLEALQAENMELKQTIKQLQKPKPDVFDVRPLDKIISDYGKEGEPAIFSKKNKQVSAGGNDMSGFMDKYREYRRLQAENDKAKDMKIELDVNALSQLKSLLKIKPA